MKTKRFTLHPATLFCLLTLAALFLSWICDSYGLSVPHPRTGREIAVQSLLGPEGIRWLLSHAVGNFTGFTPWGMGVVAICCIGIARHSGFMEACLRNGRAPRPQRVLWGVIVAGLLSNVVGDAGYVLLLPLAALLFQAAGLHPAGGLLTAYVSVACGYGVNLFLTTLDPQLSTTAREAAYTCGISFGKVGPLCNYYFLACSLVLAGFIIYHITRRRLLPRLGKYEGDTVVAAGKQRSRKERRALFTAVAVGVCYASLVLLATFSPWGILKSAGGGLIHSPFIVGVSFLLSIGIGLMGMVYGFASGRYHNDTDVAEGFAQPVRLIGTYLVIAFFAAQLSACLTYSHLGEYLALTVAGGLSALFPDGLWALPLFVFTAAVVNLFLPSATAKWGFMAFIFVPLLAQKNIVPETVLCAYRVGDSVTNVLTPLLPYMPLVLSYLYHYDRRAGYGTLLRHTWRYALVIFLAWTALLVLWHLCRLPLGL
ncbi:MAG: AbgT family transporter [Prevotellaceae bacterium]|nr:AbgT family transporter [Prevotellaceae bacterium]